MPLLEQEQLFIHQVRLGDLPILIDDRFAWNREEEVIFEKSQSLDFLAIDRQCQQQEILPPWASSLNRLSVCVSRTCSASPGYVWRTAGSK